MTPQERLKNYRNWISDLEERLAWHLFTHTNFKGESIDPEEEKRVIDVVQEVAGGWTVFLNGKKAFYFEGEGAHQKALRMATNLARVEVK